MIRTLTAKVSEPLLIPYALSHFEDEHGTPHAPNEIFDTLISGFTVEAKVEGIQKFLDNFKVKDLYHDGFRIFAEDNTVSGDQWLHDVLAIPQNMLSIEKALAEAYKEAWSN